MDEKTDFEKMTEGIYQLALLLSQYYRALLERGIPDELAQKLVIAYQGDIMKMSGKKEQ